MMGSKITDGPHSIGGSGCVGSVGAESYDRLPTPTAEDAGSAMEKPPIPRSVTVAAVTIICCLSITAYWAGDITNALKSTVKEACIILVSQWIVLD